MGTFFDLNGNAEYVRGTSRASTLSARLMHRVEKKKKGTTKPVQANKQKLYNIVFTIASINYAARFFPMESPYCTTFYISSR